MNWGGPRVGFTCGGFGLVVPRVYPPNGSIVTARYKHPRVKPTRGAPSFLNDPEYRSNGILSSIGAVMWKEKCEPALSFLSNRTAPMKLIRRTRFIWTAILLCGSVCVSQAQDVNLENVPDDVVMQFGTGSFAEIYSISGRINPFYLRGDFDGDGKSDYAILVLSKKDHLRGIAVWLSSKGKIFVLGAGHPFKFSHGDSVDFEFIETWQVHGKKPVESGVQAGPPPKLIGEALLVGKTESASGLIYWNGKQFAWYQQGD